MNELRTALEELKPYEERWISELQASVYMLPGGYLVRDYDTETYKYISSCFVPLEPKKKGTLSLQVYYPDGSTMLDRTYTDLVCEDANIEVRLEENNYG